MNGGPVLLGFLLIEPRYCPVFLVLMEARYRPVSYYRYCSLCQYCWYRIIQAPHKYLWGALRVTNVEAHAAHCEKARPQVAC